MYDFSDSKANFFEACRCCDLNLMKRYLKEGADVNATFEGKTPLHVFLQHNLGSEDFEAGLDMLLANRADLFAQEDFFRTTPLAYLVHLYSMDDPRMQEVFFRFARLEPRTLLVRDGTGLLPVDLVIKKALNSESTLMFKDEVMRLTSEVMEASGPEQSQWQEQQYMSSHGDMQQPQPWQGASPWQQQMGQQPYAQQQWQNGPQQQQWQNGPQQQQWQVVPQQQPEGESWLGKVAGWATGFFVAKEVGDMISGLEQRNNDSQPQIDSQPQDDATFDNQDIEDYDEDN